MDRPIRYGFSLFTGKFEHILLLGLTIVFPLLLVHSFLSNYIFAVTPTLLGTTLIADVYNTFLTLAFMLYAQVPFIRYLYNEYETEDKSLKNAYYHFLANGFQFFIFAIITSFLSTLGITFFLLPGLIILTLLYPIPFIATFDNKSIWKSWKAGILLGRKHFLKLFLLITIMGFIELLLSSVLTLLVYSLTTSFAAQLLSHMLLNLIFFPLITLILGSYVLKWREGSYTVDTIAVREGHS